jgi:hypothetical protein
MSKRVTITALIQQRKHQPMTPKEKAIELIDKFSGYAYTDWHGGENELTNEVASKECALIAVEEILFHAPSSPVVPGQYYELWSDRVDDAVSYWLKVKEEITKL